MLMLNRSALGSKDHSGIVCERWDPLAGICIALNREWGGTEGMGADYKIPIVTGKEKYGKRQEMGHSLG